MQFTCLESADMLLMAFPILAAMLATVGGSNMPVEHSIWQTDFGPMFVVQAQDSWFARYPEYQGVIVGKVQPGMVNGLWVQPKSDQQCNAPVDLGSDALQQKLPEMDVSDQSRYWGNVTAKFDANRLEGTWRHCGATAPAKTWVGTELCRVSLELVAKR